MEFHRLYLVRDENKCPVEDVLSKFLDVLIDVNNLLYCMKTAFSRSS